MVENFDFRAFNQETGGKLRRAIATAADHRRRVAQGDFSVFRFPFVFAVAKDGLLDPLAHIPLVGVLIIFAFSIPVAVYLFIFMWGRGKWKVRLVAMILSLFDIVPVVGLIPWQTVSVAYAYHLAKKDAQESKNELEKTKRVLPRLRRQADRIVGSPGRIEQRVV